MSRIRFEKPLRVFLSDAHDDDRETELVKKFRQHLEGSLPVEAKLWSDRQIGPGSEWEKRIAEELDTAHLFIALTSAAFGSSSYINSKELKRALERHEEGTCLLIPVRLRAWTVPEHLSRFQFLPIAMPVEHGEVEVKLAEVIGAIREAIKDIVPAASRPVATRTMSEVPRETVGLSRVTPSFEDAYVVLEDVGGTVTGGTAVTGGDAYRGATV